MLPASEFKHLYSSFLVLSKVLRDSLTMFASFQAPDGESQPSTEVDLFISTEKIMVLNTDLKVSINKKYDEAK